MNDTTTIDQLVKPERAAEILGTTPGVLRNWRHEGKGPAYVKVGRSVRYRESQLAAFVSELDTVLPVSAWAAP